MSLAELAEETDVPSAFLYKVLRTLVEKGLIVGPSRQGRGLRVASPRAPVEACSTSSTRSTACPVLNVCLSTVRLPSRRVAAPRTRLGLAQQRMREVLADTSLVDLARGRRLELHRAPVLATGTDITWGTRVSVSLAPAGARVPASAVTTGCLHHLGAARRQVSLAGSTGNGR